MGDSDDHDVDVQAHVRLTCVGCGRSAGVDAHGWLCFSVDDPDAAAEPELAFYCPACATREFGA